MKKVIIISGSTRQGSLNTKLAHCAYNILSQNNDINVEIVDLSNYDMPIYNGDMEEQNGLPEKAAQFKEKLQACDGFVMTSPEYNGFFSPLLKNAIDWASRPHGNQKQDEQPTYKGKIAAIAACSPGGLGGIRGLPHLRTLLSGIGVHVTPMQTSVGNGFQAFDDENNLTNDQTAQMFQAQMDEFVHVLTNL